MSSPFTASLTSVTILDILCFSLQSTNAAHKFMASSNLSPSSAVIFSPVSELIKYVGVGIGWSAASAFLYSSKNSGGTLEPRSAIAFKILFSSLSFVNNAKLSRICCCLKGRLAITAFITLC